MLISDWSSDVCSSDLLRLQLQSAADPALGLLSDLRRGGLGLGRAHHRHAGGLCHAVRPRHLARLRHRAGTGGTERKSVVSGKSVSVRVDLGGSRIIKKKIKNEQDKQK